MSIQLYNKFSNKSSKYVTNLYSTSFSIGIFCFNRNYRQDIYNIYGFVRLADEIVDTFHDKNKKELFEEFKKETYLALERKFSLNPILHSFQHTINKYNIDKEYIEAFLNSMEMDLTTVFYNKEKLGNYIYGSAEVVGLMCLKVFVKGDEEKFNSLKQSACALGSAFQKVNFLRDFASDRDERNRDYLSININGKVNEHSKRDIEKEIEYEFKLALEGIKNLPSEFKFGVYTAYIYYQSLFRKIKSLPVEELNERRVRINNLYKLILLVKSYFKSRVLMQI